MWTVASSRLASDIQQCSNNGMTSPNPTFLIDALGRRHMPAPDARIVSLVPSITELLCELGLAAQVVGRTGFCIHPRDTVAAIPKVGGTKDVNVEKIRRLAPTHVVVNIDENDKPVVDALAAFVPHVVVTHPNAPDDNVALARLLGGIFGAADAAERWCAAFETELAALRRDVNGLARGPARTVLYCIWQDPWMTVSAGTYIAAMLAELGWRVPALGTQRYPRFAWSAELVDGVDAVLLSTEPYRFTDAHVDALEKQIGIPVFLVDGEMMSWYGSRALAGVRYLRQVRAMVEGS
jgi:ABC-type Fe3+-hydroxamate transport system substrate-binding protein